MIIDASEHTILDHAGWGDEHGTLWRYDIAAGVESRGPRFEGSISLHPADDGQHVLVVESRSLRHRCSLRPIATPADVVAAATLEKGRWEIQESPLWARAPCHVVVPTAEPCFGLLTIDPDTPEIDPLEWYRTGPYDHGYQGVLGAYAVPDTELVLVTVQRDSQPVLYDPFSRQVVTRLSLADRGGNPSVIYRENEAIIDDYDTIVAVDLQSWKPMRSVRLQETDDGIRRFIGSPWLSRDEGVLVVPRPNREDVVLLDPADFRIVATVAMEAPPLDAVLLRNGRVIARDWQTRAVLHGQR